MYHYGDIQKINGANVPLVDVITFGSPCQDVSVAGKRAGMKHTDKGDEETTRSGLFFEAIRIIKEQRNECIRQLSMRRTNEPVRSCRYAIYENVPGALSSNKGEDFRCVLEEICKIADENATIPRPQGGAKWSYAGLIVGNKPHGTYSIAWRVHDLQYFGCPQRRRRLCVLADFDGDTAGKILFELQRETTDPETVKTFGDIGEEPRPEIQPFGESLSRNSEQGEQTGEKSTTVTERNIGKAMSFQERAGRPGGGARDS